jgi:hypothetical protein
MKQLGVLVLFILSLLPMQAYEAVLIDFNDLEGTTIDFSHYAGEFWTEEQKKEMVKDLAPDNWLVKVNSSSWTKEARERTYVITVDNSLQYPNQKLLGIRAYFPERYANSYALVTPPFEIPTYYDNPDEPDGLGSMFLYKGVVRNVGVLRKLGVRILGNNFKYAFYVRVVDRKGEERDIFIGFLNFIGWQTRTWVNPHYDYEVKLREQLKNERPYYPDEYPYIKLKAFLFHRAEPEVTGNFVTMIKSVDMEYDEQFLEVGKAEYLQEDTFGIYKEELIYRAKKEMERVDERIFLEWLEKERQHKEVE